MGSKAFMSASSSDARDTPPPKRVVLIGDLHGNLSEGKAL